MMQRRSDGPRERGMEGFRDCTESEGRRRERQRGIVLCGSPRSLFALVAAATAGERTDKLTRWLETEREG